MPANQVDAMIAARGTGRASTLATALAGMAGARPGRTTIDLTQDGTSLTLTRDVPRRPGSGVVTGLSRLTGVEGWILDVDGCLVRTSRAGGTGGTPIPGAAELLTGLAERGHRVVVCTNASELPPAAYAEHLREIGLPVADEDFVTAGSAGADHIAAAHPGGRVVAVGGPGITVPLRERGLEVVEADGLRDPGECAAVLVGAAPSYTHAALNAACLAIEAGAPLYVSQNQ
ncbi:ribonucleotide monophosphatase NagD (HAD superfamily), partial [Nocardioides soli]|nr:ribonucleotide monophosphatase NagD (HAD superfamily) [Nocardioides soli]